MRYVVSLTLLFIARSAIADDDAALETALAVLEHQEGVLPGFVAEYAVDIQITEPLNHPTKVLVHQKQSFRETRAGSKFRSNRSITMNADDGSPSDEILQTFDGERFNSLVAAESQGGIFSEGVEPTCLYATIYLTPLPLGKFLREKQAEATARWDTIDGRRLLVVEWLENDDATRRIYGLDPAAGYQPRFCRSESEYPDGYNPDGTAHSVFAGTVNRYHRQGDWVLPAAMTFTQERSDGRNRVSRRVIKQVDVTWETIDQPIDPAEFKIAFPDGTEIVDKVRGVRYIVGQPDSERPLDTPPPTPTTAEPVAGPPYTWWADWRVWIAASAACGIAFFGARRRMGD